MTDASRRAGGPPVVLAEVTRGLAPRHRDGAIEAVDDDGAFVESRHRGHLVVVAGPVGGPPGTVLVLGDGRRPVLVRSAAKPFQATACLELLDECGVAVPPDDELAVGWASHRGERRHLEAVRSLLARSGTAPEQLTCPSALPEADTVWPPASPGEPPSRLRFNCSGKHALFALAGAAIGSTGSTLLDPTAPLQRRVVDVLDEAIGPVLGLAVDGCGAPAVLTPLAGLAVGYRELALGGRWRRVRDAGFAHPGLVGGEGRLESALLGAGVVAKVGAEAVYGAGWVAGDTAVGVAVKIEDGQVRGASVALLDTLVALGAVPRSVWAPPPVTGGGVPVGEVRASALLRSALDGIGSIRGPG